MFVNRSRHVYSSGKKCALKNSFCHRRRDARAPAPGQRRQDHRHVHVALMVRREHHRPIEASQVLAGPDSQMANTRASGRIHVASESRRISATGQRAVPRREVDRLVDRRSAVGPCSTSCLQIADARGFREPSLVDARLKPILERDHQLDAFERAESELLERRGAAHIRGRGRSAR